MKSTSTPKRRQPSWQAILEEPLPSQSKLTAPDVLTIMRMHCQGYTVGAIHVVFRQVSQRQIYRIVRGEKWRSFTDRYRHLFDRRRR